MEAERVGDAVALKVDEQRRKGRTEGEFAERGCEEGNQLEADLYRRASMGCARGRA